MSNVFPAPTQRLSCSAGNAQERRRRERLRVRLPVYVRRLDHSHAEVAMTVDITRHGLCFSTSKDHYAPGMGLYLTFPYSPENKVRKEYFGEVVRVDDLGSRGCAVAVRFRP